jgi:hypothetical protein
MCTELAKLLSLVLGELFAFTKLHRTNDEPFDIAFLELFVPEHHFLFVPSEFFAAPCTSFHGCHVCLCVVFEVIRFCAETASLISTEEWLYFRNLTFDNFAVEISDNLVPLRIGFVSDCIAFGMELDAVEGFGIVFDGFYLA